MSRLYLALLLITVSSNAAAYLDPGTGSLILQGLIAGIAIAGMTIKSYWYRITAWFGNEDKANSLLDDEESDTKSDA